MSAIRLVLGLVVHRYLSIRRRLFLLGYSGTSQRRSHTPFAILAQPLFPKATLRLLEVDILASTPQTAHSSPATA